MDHKDIDCVIVGCNKYYIPSLQAAQFVKTQLSCNNIWIFSNRIFDFREHNFNYVNIPNVNSKMKYSKYILREIPNMLLNFYKDKVYKPSHFLIFQWDGFVMDGSKWNDEFLNYDYIGAPWNPSVVVHEATELYNGEPRVGNGGFSLRSYKFMDTLCSKETSEILSPLFDLIPEDALLSFYYRKYIEEYKGLKFAPYSLAKNFSCESFQYDGNQFGFHGINDFNKFLPQEIQSMLEYSKQTIIGYERNNNGIRNS